MKIVVNGRQTETGAKTLEELCAILGFTDARVATAVNGDFVPETARNAHPLGQNDKVEIVSPRQGG